MPTYQYACTECGHDFEAVQSFTDASLVECPVCAGRLRKVFGAVGIVFKGSGFYRTDSRDAKKTADAPAKVDATSDSSSSAKADSTSGAKPAAKDGGSSSSSSPGTSSPPAAKSRSTSTAGNAA